MNTYYLYEPANSMPFTSNLHLWSPMPSSKVVFSYYNHARTNDRQYQQARSNTTETATAHVIQQPAEDRERQEDEEFHSYQYYQHQPTASGYFYADQKAFTSCNSLQHSQQHNYYQFFCAIPSSSSSSSTTVIPLQQQQQSYTLSNSAQTATMSSELPFFRTVFASFTAPDLITTPAPSVDGCSSDNAPVTTLSSRGLRFSQKLKKSNNGNTSDNDNDNVKKPSVSTVRDYIHALRVRFYKYYRGYRAMLLQPPTILKKKETKNPIKS